MMTRMYPETIRLVKGYVSLSIKFRYNKIRIYVNTANPKRGMQFRFAPKDQQVFHAGISAFYS
jgi:hypothetical protein